MLIELVVSVSIVLVGGRKWNDMVLGGRLVVLSVFSVMKWLIELCVVLMCLFFRLVVFFSVVLGCMSMVVLYGLEWFVLIILMWVFDVSVKIIGVLLIGL